MHHTFVLLGSQSGLAKFIIFLLFFQLGLGSEGFLACLFSLRFGCVKYQLLLLSLHKVFLLSLQMTSKRSLLGLAKELTDQLLVHVLRRCRQALLGASGEGDRRRELEILTQFWEIVVDSKELLQETALLDGGYKSDVLDELLQDLSPVFDH